MPDTTLPRTNPEFALSPNREVTFMPAQAGDADSLADLRVEAMRESLERVGRFDPRRARARFLNSFSPDDTQHVLVCGEKVGFYVVKLEAEDLVLDHLYIKPGDQGKGVGAAVLAQVFALADKERRSVRVGALKMSDANRFYARHGFVLVEQGEFDNYYLRHSANTLERGRLMPSPVLVRPIQPTDLEGWKPLWDGYNAFYGREGASALAHEITAATWRRFFDPDEPVFALVAESQGQLLGLSHHLFHRSTTRVELTCYLQDLFTDHSARGRGVGRRLIEGVYQAAKAAGIRRVYWQTHESNAAGRALYDKLARHAGFIVYGHDV